MNRPIFFLLLCLGMLNFSFGQSPGYFDLQGQVVDAVEHTPLEAATVMILSVQDSSLINFGRSEADGRFRIRQLKNDQAYLLRITYLGYQLKDVVLPFPVTQEVHALGEVPLPPKTELLEEVVVKEEHIPVTIRNDTIEYNARAFKTRPNAPVEDLIKKLPGVEVDREGNIRAQGKQVEQVTVDGKEFFGRDPKAATRNLPAEAVDKVQVYDKRSEQAEFSGVDDGSRQKTLNLELKDDFKKGAFGSIEAGYGTEDRFNTKGNLNRFTPRQQLSLIGMGNNINRQGFSLNDYMQFSGAMRQMMSGGGGSMRLSFNSDDMDFPIDFGANTGFTTTWAGGLNFNHEWEKGNDFRGNYIFSNLDRDTETETLRENYLPIGTFLFESNTRENNLRQGHLVNLGFNQELDSLNQIRWDIRLQATNNERVADGTSQTFDQEENLQNESSRSYQLQGHRRNLNSEFLFRHRFRRPGRNISAGLNFSLGNNDRQGNLRSVNHYYAEGSPFLDSIAQKQQTRTNTLGYGLNLTHTEPLGSRRYLEFSYAYNHLNSDLDREVLDIDDNSEVFNQNLSNNYKNDYNYHRIGAQFRLNRRRYNFLIGIERQESSLLGRQADPESRIKRNFGNWLPKFQFVYEPVSGRNLRFDYRSSVREPSMEELQPIVDNTDPLNLYLGNPDLKAANVHDLSVNFLSFSQATMTNLFGMLDLRYTQNAISTAQIVDEQLRRILQPVNVADDIEFNAHLSYGFRIRPVRSRIELLAEARTGRSINLVNNEENRIHRLFLIPRIRWSYTGNEKLDPYVEVSWNYNRMRYGIQADAEQVYSNANYQAGLDAQLPARFSISTSFDMNNYYWSDKAVQKVPIWNLSVSRYFFKGDRGELRLSVFDLLNKNLGISQQANLSYYQEERIRSLGRYFMLSFTYAIRQNGGPQVRMHQMRVIRR